MRITYGNFPALVPEDSTDNKFVLEKNIQF